MIHSSYTQSARTPKVDRILRYKIHSYGDGASRLACRESETDLGGGGGGGGEGG